MMVDGEIFGICILGNRKGTIKDETERDEHLVTVMILLLKCRSTRSCDVM